MIITILFSLNIFFSKSLFAAKNTDPLYIAVACPLTGPSSKKGIEMLEGIQMYISYINDNGGIFNRNIELLIFDDQNKPEIAIQKAKEIIDSKSLIVLGHRSSTACIAAGSIYKKNKIAAITGTATADLVTQENDWYFRIILNNYKQGQFIAFYTKSILNKNNVSIIYDTDEYGKSLLKAFETSAKTFDLNIDQKWFFTTNGMSKAQLDLKYQQIVDSIKQQKNINTIFLAVHDVEAVPIVKKIKDSDLDITFIGAASIGKQSFAKRFNKYSVEKLFPGFYTDGIFATTYFLYDLSNQKAQKFRSLFNKKYNKIPGAVSISSYDIAAVAIDAIKNAGILNEDINADRIKIKNYLKRKDTLKKAYPGASGHIYFDKEGDAVKLLPMGVFNKQKFISAPVQFTQINNLKEIELFKKNKEVIHENKKIEKIVNICGQFMRKTNVVYTGVGIKSISSIDIDNMLCDINFNIWFRYSGDVDITNIQFINSNEPIELKEPIKQINGKYNYRLFNVKGNFKINFAKTEIDYGKYQLGFNFTHQNLSRENLIFVSDLLSMNLDETAKSSILSNNKDWKVNDIIFFQDIMQDYSYGNPHHIYKLKQTIDYSRFNAQIIIEKNELQIRRCIEEEVAWYLSVISALILFFIYFISILYKKLFYSKIILFFQFILTLLLLITLESAFVNNLLHLNHTKFIEFTIKAFDILLFMLPAFFIHIAIERYLWQPLEEQAHKKISNLVRSSTGFFLYSIAFACIIAFVFDQALTSILATSGVVAMIVGLAIQVNISNVFSGIIINLEHSFRIGDWVNINNEVEGRVYDISWRTTQIMTRTNDIIFVPNQFASDSVIQNFSAPDKKSELKIEVLFSSDEDVNAIEKCIMSAVKKIEGIHSPSLRFRIDKTFVRFILFFNIFDYGNKFILLDAVHRCVWNSLKKSNIKTLSTPSNLII